MHGVLT